MKINEPSSSSENTKYILWLYELYRLGLFTSSSQNPKEVQQRILDHIVLGFEGDSGCLALCSSDDRDRLIIVAGMDLPQKVIGSAVKKGEGVLGWVAQEGEPLLLNGSITNDERFSNVPPRNETTTPRSSMCWPLALDGRVIGVLSVNRFEGKRAFTEKDLRNGGIMVEIITIVIENTQLHIEQKQRIEMLAQANEKNREIQARLEDARIEAVHARNQLDRILSTLDNVLWSIEPDTFKILYLNPAAEKIYGRSISDFYTNPKLWLESIHPEDRGIIEKSLKEISQNGLLDIEYRIVRPDGEIRWIHDRIHPIYDDAALEEQGQPSSLTGLATDITLNKQATLALQKSHSELQDAYRRLQEVQSQLLQSEKMASIGQLAAGVAHEINNPIGYVNSNLGSLQSYIQDLFTLIDAYEETNSLLEPQHTGALAGIQTLKEKIDLDFLRGDVLTLLSESREGISRVKKIVQDLKDFSHAGSEDDWQWADLRKGLDGTLNIVWNEIKYKAEVKKDYGDIPDIECLPSQLNQVFMNLLVNAAHAIEEKGAINLKTGSQDDKVWVEVSDTGKGISAEHLSRIFDPFFTTKPVGKGTGLGLALSYSIVQKHHGRIDVESEVGKGTRFTIWLPINQLKIRG
jgi:PAS domain S-box-containing protein